MLSRLLLGTLEPSGMMSVAGIGGISNGLPLVWALAVIADKDMIRIIIIVFILTVFKFIVFIC